MKIDYKVNRVKGWFLQKWILIFPYFSQSGVAVAWGASQISSVPAQLQCKLHWTEWPTVYV